MIQQTETDSSELNERTVRAAVDAAVLAERARCAEVARKAWMTGDWIREQVAQGRFLVNDEIAARVVFCDEIAKLLEAG